MGARKQEILWTGEVKWRDDRVLIDGSLCEKPDKVISFDNGIRNSDIFKMEGTNFYSGWNSPRKAEMTGVPNGRGTHGIELLFMFIIVTS